MCSSIRRRPSRVAARSGSGGMSAVASSANTPPTTPSRVRENGPPTGAGTSITSVDCTAAAIAYAGLPVNRRATASVSTSVMAYWSKPVPNRSSSNSARAMPSVIATTVSSTRTGRASRANPRAVITTMAATMGCGCPSTSCANATAATAVTVIWSIAGTDSPSRLTPLRRRAVSAAAEVTPGFPASGVSVFRRLRPHRRGRSRPGLRRPRCHGSAR